MANVSDSGEAVNKAGFRIPTILFLGLICLVSAAFVAKHGLDEVINSLKTGNAAELSKYVDDNIVISLPDKTDTYSRAQALIVLQDFFSNNGVKGFDVQFKGENGGSEFCVGKLITKSGNYRTTVFLTTKSAKQLVKEIRFQSM